VNEGLNVTALALFENLRQSLKNLSVVWPCDEQIR
jgi:hypothetical protein